MVPMALQRPFADLRGACRMLRAEASRHACAGVQFSFGAGRYTANVLVLRTTMAATTISQKRVMLRSFTGTEARWCSRV